MSLPIDFGKYRTALFFIEAYLLGDKDKPISRSGAKHRLEKMPHSFLPVGDGVHLMPVTIHGFPIGYSSPPPRPILLRKDLWIPDPGIDRDYLILGSFLFADVEALLADSPEGRRELAIRAYRVFQALGFPKPQMGHYTWRRIDARLFKEKEARRNIQRDAR